MERSEVAELFKVAGVKELNEKELDSLICFHDMLLEKNQNVNLISKNTVQDIWVRHFLDSAQIYNLIEDKNIVIDVGSGGGFPGMVLSIIGIKKLYMIESITKKADFLKQASAASSLGEVVVINDRVESIAPIQSSAVVARSVAPLHKLLPLLVRMANASKQLILFKGENYQNEINQVKNMWHIEYEAVDSLTNEGSKIIVISKLRRKFN